MGLSRSDLTTIATRTGKKVVAAWSDRNQGSMGTVYGVVLHHTGTAQNTASRSPTLQIVREGRSDLQNALSTFYIDKDGVIYLVTEKVAWHAGQGSYRGITDGNGHLLGIEAESDGVTWTAATVDAYVALVAEICRFLKADVSTWAIRHATWATPPGRKTDFAGLSEADFKARVTARLNGQAEDDDVTPQDKQDIINGTVLGIINRQIIGAGTPADPGMQLWEVLRDLETKTTEVHDRQVGYGNRIEDTQARVTAMQSAPAATVNVDAAAVATALAANTAFVAAIVKAVNDDAAKRLAS